MAAIFTVSSLSDVPLPSGASDKSGHALAYAGLGVFVVRAFAGGLPRRVTPGVALAALALTIGYGASDEIHQAFVPGRTADVADLYADAGGAIAATAACWAWGIIRFRPHRLTDASHDGL
jgi:VanZ family protein